MSALTCQCGQWPISEYGVICPSCPRSTVVIWDWKEQPPWVEINAALRLGFVFLTEVEDTGCDSYALVCSREALAPAEAQRMWAETIEHFDDRPLAQNLEAGRIPPEKIEIARRLLELDATMATRREDAETVFGLLRDAGPKSAATIQADLGWTKRRTENAVYDLMTRDRIEYSYPTTSPFSYVARAEA